MQESIGIAFDVGTTTVAASAVDLQEKKTLDTLSIPNPQSAWGKDVLSRIRAAADNPGALEELRKSIIGTCNGLIKKLAKGRGVSAFSIAGNPVMEHIFLGISPEPLGKVPYKPAFREAKEVLATTLGLEAENNANAFIFPLVGGFVGGDAVSVLLSQGMGFAERNILAIDIGTNSEILLSAKGNIFVTSAAAGPAFEGGEIKFGMTAGPGAIAGMQIEDDRITLDVIGSVPPKGICGSGLIDIVSGLVRAGIIESSGRIKDRDEVASNLANRITQDEGANAFVLYRGAKGEVALSQDDIRSVQTAKAAIKAGITVLLKKAGIDPLQIDEVLIAGAFGSSVKKEGLLNIGLLEPSWLAKIKSVGDAALDGAVMALCDKAKRVEAEELAKKAKFVSLSGSAHFEKEFLREMDFPRFDS